MSGFSVSRAGAHHHLLNQYRANQRKAHQSLERLSTGKAINRPKDNPAGYIAAEELRGELTSLRAEKASRERDIAQIRTRESSLSAIQDLLQALNASAVNAANDASSPGAKDDLQDQVAAAQRAVDLITSRDGTVAGYVPSDVGNLESFAEQVTQAVRDTLLLRASEGTNNRTLEVLNDLAEDLINQHTKALSSIEDADFAKEASNLVEGQILSESAMAALQFKMERDQEFMDATLRTIDITA